MDKVDEFINTKDILQALINHQGVNQKKDEREIHTYGKERSRQE